MHSKTSLIGFCSSWNQASVLPVKEAERYPTNLDGSASKVLDGSVEHDVDGRFHSSVREE